MSVSERIYHPPEILQLSMTVMCSYSSEKQMMLGHEVIRSHHMSETDSPNLAGKTLNSFDDTGRHYANIYYISL